LLHLKADTSMQNTGVARARSTIVATGALALAACAGTVTTMASGSGTSAGGSTSGPASSSTGSLGDAGMDAGYVPPTTTVTGSDAGCPETTPDQATACPIEGLACAYQTGACVLTMTCISTVPPPPPLGPGLFCGPTPTMWSLTSGFDCDGCAGGAGCVTCTSASPGDRCDVVAAICMAAPGGNCWNYKICGQGHTWGFQGMPACCP
jgi:hypothetical protein